MKRCVVWLTGLVVALACLCGAQAQERGGRTLPSSCVPKVWKSHSQDVWFYDEEGERVVPEIEERWIAVSFVEPFEDLLPEHPEIGLQASPERPGDGFWTDLFDHFVFDPSMDERVAVYHAKAPWSPEELATLPQRLQASGLAVYAHPALRIDGDLYTLLDRARVRWKTTVDEKRREKLLGDAGAVESGSEPPGSHRETLVIDVCRVPVWKAANWLAEDIHVVSASPVLFEVRPPVQCELSLEMNGGQVGTALPFRLEIRFVDRIRLDPGSVAGLSLKPGEVFRNLFEVDYDRPLSSVDADRSPVMVTGRLYFYTPGEFSIPDLSFQYEYRRDGRTETGTVQAGGMPVKIASLIPSRERNARLLTGPPEPLQPPGTEALEQKKMVWLGASVSGLIVFLVCSGFLLMRIGKGRPKEEDLGPEGEALQQVRQNLRALAAQGEKGALEAHDLSGFARAFRKYLSLYAGFSESPGGSCTLFFETVSPGLPEEEKPAVWRVLWTLEDMLAREEMDPRHVRDCFQEALEVADRLHSSSAGEKT